VPNINFLNLFDGETLNGWKMAGKGSFVVLQKENVLQTQGGMGLLWYYKRKFKDFTLELEWKVSSKRDNSGVFVRFPNPGDDPYVAVRHGYEVQIDDLAQPDGKPIHGTGAFYDFAALPVSPLVEFLSRLLQLPCLVYCVEDFLYMIYDQSLQDLRQG
jgi:hypothetical protein